MMSLLSSALFLGCAPQSDVSDPGPSEDNFTAASLEKIPADEAADTAKLASLIAESMKKSAGEEGEGRRGVHPKSHGCVKATVTTTENLPAGLSSPVFGGNNAWIRFSNANQRSQSDQEADSRGMAIKILGVSGTRLIQGEKATTLDLTFQNNEVFFIRNIKDFVEFAEATKGSKAPLEFFFPSLNPFKFRLHEGKIVQQIRSHKVPNPLQPDYFTTAPLLFGNAAVKMAAKPCVAQQQNARIPEGDNYLRDQLKKTLSQVDACYSLMVQKQTNPNDMPVEDPTITWEQDKSPFVKIATVVIPKQVFDTPAQNQYCEDLSFTPWHGVQEHRPLGGINRGRKVVYETSSKLRHELNARPRAPEPTNLDVPN
jgi:hypothetical protein